MRVVRFSDLEELAPYAERWDRLAAGPWISSAATSRTRGISAPRHAPALPCGSLPIALWPACDRASGWPARRSNTASRPNLRIAPLRPR